MINPRDPDYDPVQAALTEWEADHNARLAREWSPLMSIKAAAVYLKVHPTTVRRWIGEGVLPAVRIGPRLLRVRQHDVHRLGRMDEDKW